MRVFSAYHTHTHAHLYNTHHYTHVRTHTNTLDILPCIYLNGHSVLMSAPLHLACAKNATSVAHKILFRSGRCGTDFPHTHTHSLPYSILTQKHGIVSERAQFISPRRSSRSRISANIRVNSVHFSVEYLRSTHACLSLSGRAHTDDRTYDRTHAREMRLQCAMSARGGLHAHTHTHTFASHFV